MLAGKGSLPIIGLTASEQPLMPQQPALRARAESYSCALMHFACRAILSQNPLHVGLVVRISIGIALEPQRCAMTA